MKIVTKIVLLVIISVSIIMGGVSLLISNRMEQTVHAQIDRVLSTNLEFVEKDIVKTTADIRRTVEIIAHNRAIRKALSLSVSRGINQILNELVTIYPFFNFVVIAEPNGDIFAASTRDGDGRKVGGEQLLGLNIKENPMIEEILEIFTASSKGVTYGRPGNDPYLERMGMERGESQWFVAPVHERGGLIGWVMLSYDWGVEMSALLKATTKHLIDIGNPTIETLLINPDGQIVAGASARQGRFEPDPSTLWKRRRVMIGRSPMDLIIVDDLSKTNEPVVKTRNLLLAIVLIGSIALVVILYFLLRHILLRRLDILHEGADQLGRGNNFTSRLPGLGNDEIGALASAFNRMAEWLQSTTVSRDHLEALVDERTEELARQAEQLEVALVHEQKHNTLQREFVAMVSHEFRGDRYGVKIVGPDAAPVFAAVGGLIRPGVPVGEKRMEQPVVGGMARADAGEGADNGGAGQIKVAHGVQHLVADELICVSQAVFVEDLVAADHHGVVQGPAPGQAGGP